MQNRGEETRLNDINVASMRMIQRPLYTAEPKEKGPTSRILAKYLNIYTPK